MNTLFTITGMPATSSHMKALLISIALAACTSAVPAQYEPDAGVRDSDASVAPDNAITDAGPNAPKDGCNMGNLPISRTITLTPADPVPSALLDELQDRDIASSGTRKIFIAAAAFCDSGSGSGAGTAALNNDVWTLTNAREVSTSLSLPVGTTITNIRLSVNRAVGSSPGASVRKRDFGTGGGAGVDVLATGAVVPTATWTI